MPNKVAAAALANLNAEALNFANMELQPSVCARHFSGMQGDACNCLARTHQCEDMMLSFNLTRLIAATRGVTERWISDSHTREDESVFCYSGPIAYMQKFNNQKCASQHQNAAQRLARGKAEVLITPFLGHTNCLQILEQWISSRVQCRVRVKHARLNSNHVNKIRPSSHIIAHIARSFMLLHGYRVLQSKPSPNLIDDHSRIRPLSHMHLHLRQTSQLLATLRPSPTKWCHQTSMQKASSLPAVGT